MNHSHGILTGNTTELLGLMEDGYQVTGPDEATTVRYRPRHRGDSWGWITQDGSGRRFRSSHLRAIPQS